MKLSIITVNLNNRDGLEKTILSTIQQSSQDFELIIIDGASKDGSVGVISKYEHDIDFWVSEKDQGIYDAMNKGIGKSRGEYLLFLNSGDYLLSDQTLSKALAVDYSEDFILFDFIRNTLTGKESTTYSDPSFEFLINGSICHQSVLHKRTVFEKIGLYNYELQIAADYELFLKAFFQHNCSYRFIAQELTLYNDIEGKSKDKVLLKSERRLALESVLDYRVVNLLEKQSNTISDLFKYQDRYEGLMNSKSVGLALEVSRFGKSIIESIKKLTRPTK